MQRSVESPHKLCGHARGYDFLLSELRHNRETGSSGFVHTLKRGYTAREVEDPCDKHIRLEQISRDRGEHMRHIHACPRLLPCSSLPFSRSCHNRWAAGDTNWHEARESGEAIVQGSDEAWDRMLLATAYPGHPADITNKVLAQSEVST